jgi:hypothetical protein
MENSLSEVTKWPSDQWPSDQMYPMVIVMKLCIVVVCTPKKVYHQVTKWPVIRWLSDQVTKWPNEQVSKWPSDQWQRWWTISSKLQFKMENSLSDLVTKWPVTKWSASRKNKKYCTFKSSSINTIKRVSFKWNWRRSKARRVQLVHNKWFALNANQIEPISYILL